MMVASSTEPALLKKIRILVQRRVVAIAIPGVDEEHVGQGHADVGHGDDQLIEGGGPFRVNQGKDGLGGNEQTDHPGLHLEGFNPYAILVLALETLRPEVARGAGDELAQRCVGEGDKGTR